MKRMRHLCKRCAINSEEFIEICEFPLHPQQIIIEWRSRFILIDKTKVTDIIKELVFAAQGDIINENP